MSQSTLKSVQVTAGKRTYFIDLAQNEKGFRYLKISESKKTDTNGYERSSILVPATELGKFVDALQTVVAALPKEGAAA